MMYFMNLRSLFLLVLSIITLTGCKQDTLVVSDISEREANEIIVLLASKGIPAKKAISAAASPGGAQGAPKWSIVVGQDDSTDAMAILNQSGLPRIRGTNLLDLFGKQGLMTSDKEDTIRYQAGLSEQIAGTIRKIDGVIDADVQISFPNTDSSSAMPWEQTSQQKITAAVYVKHQGILDDPNSHLIMKIKRLVSGSIQGLDVNDVTVISDRARFSDITQGNLPEALTMGEKDKEYVNIWSIVMSKTSASRFRTLFFILCFASVLFALLTGWFIWKLYPLLKSKGGLKKLFVPTPLPVAIEEQKSEAHTEDKPHP
ncbi:MAG: EscJ/YscJ/HrcJ family type III secretion inner membrane ring protein [Chlamydiae bacterium]|nr:EscJ/YscJ/HrcJ family type III secretion inner membrane ring protein [Chlamydiota bacterium]